MKRTDPRVRKRCREVHGDTWFEVDAATKKARQDAAIKHLESLTPVSNASGAAPCQPLKESASVLEQQLRVAVAKTLPKGYRIKSIRDVRDDGMRACFDTVKRTTVGTEERAWLFHGTTHAAAKRIALNGFNRSFCGRNATAFGKGVYFARDISYSVQATYSPADDTGEKVVFAARVLVGKTTIGNATMLEPGDGFDTTVNSAQDPTIFVVYKDYQAIPEFEIRLASDWGR